MFVDFMNYIALSNRLQSRIEKIIDQNEHKIESKHKHFTFIVNNNRIISYGWNHNFKTHPRAVGNRNSTIHSELNAILRLDVDDSYLLRCDLINIRITRSGRYGLSKPCKHCYSILSNYGFKNIIWSIDSRDLKFTKG